MDFQKSSVSLLQKENTLTSVVREIEKYMTFYKNFEECSRVLSHSKTMQDSRELLSVLHKIRRSIDFFKAHFEFQKAELYQKRFERLKEQTLELISARVFLIIRDVYREVNLALVKT